MLTTYNTCGALQYTTCQSRGGQAGGTAVCSPSTPHVQHYNIQHVRVEGVRQEGQQCAHHLQHMCSITIYNMSE